MIASYASFHQARWHSTFSEPTTVESFLAPRATYGLRDYEEAPPGLRYPHHENHCALLLQQLGLEYLRKRPLSALSNGEWRRLLLARALLARPRLLLLDDPLGGLDPEARRRVVETVAYWQTQERDFPQVEVNSDGLPQRGVPTLACTTPRPEELNILTTRTFEIKSAANSVAEPQSSLSAPRLRASTTADSRNLATDTPVLRLRNATVRSGELALLDHVSFAVWRGQHWLITGPNGAGKSTLLALLLGDHPQSYVVDLEVLGLRAGPGVTLRERQKHIGFMAPELAAHYPAMWSIRDVVISGLNASIGQFVTPSPADEQLAEEWLRHLGFPNDTHRTLGSLSEAQTRKVFLARAVMSNPTLLMLDEPTQGLTHSESLELLNLIDMIVQARGLTLIIISHHALERPRCITHHLTLEQGRVIYSAPLGDAPRG
jgi:molybdate transport system ATP-binding protein